ncbi:MAG TPA: PhzF family phenazine biosynthesis protein [Candidatus Methylomirabilis sp.]|nr:PhzF family phenazine biosynthesis protein [Candidatus Methylomirabilis sp.]
MPTYAYRIVNVFAETPLAGNPLCVFEDARGLDDQTMQALALQFNLSETTFIFPAASSAATARVRIFTPTFEMPFAGHPTLGTAHVVRDLLRVGDALRLDMKAGVIPVTAEGNVWTLEANAPEWRAAGIARRDIAAMLGVDEDDVRDGALWVDTGSEQLVVPLTSPAAVERCRPSADLLGRYSQGAKRQGLAYVWARNGDAAVTARFFFMKQASLVEDPGTGSACANLGGWLIANDASLPLALSVSQGEAVGRPCRLGLRVDAQRRIFVSGRVIELGRGVVSY